MNKIVILGAGYAGLTAAVQLRRQLSAEEAKITLIDRHDYKLLSTNLYEAAASEEEFVSVAQIKQSIALPLKPILKSRQIEFVKSNITGVDSIAKKVLLDRGGLNYDYLISALGSQTNFYGVKGAERYAHSLKTLPDALRLRNALEFAVQRHQGDIKKPPIRFVIAGGGYTGVELASQLSKLVEVLSWKYQYPLAEIEVVVIEAGSRLIAGCNSKVGEFSLGKLQERGVRIEFGCRIAEVVDGFIILADGQKWEYDVLVWTAGVKPVPLPNGLSAPADVHGHFKTDEFCRLFGYENIFVIGDQAVVENENKAFCADTAQHGVHQGNYLAQALPIIIKNKKPAAFVPQKHGFIVPFGEDWAIMDYHGWFSAGRFAALAREYALWDYLKSIIGWWKAFRIIVLEHKVFSRVD